MGPCAVGTAGGGGGQGGYGGCRWSHQGTASAHVSEGGDVRAEGSRGGSRNAGGGGEGSWRTGAVVAQTPEEIRTSACALNAPSPLLLPRCCWPSSGSRPAMVTFRSAPLSGKARASARPARATSTPAPLPPGPSPASHFQPLPTPQELAPGEEEAGGRCALPSCARQAHKMSTCRPAPSPPPLPDKRCRPVDVNWPPSAVSRW